MSRCVRLNSLAYVVGAWLLIGPASTGFGQGTKEDYARAEGFRNRTRGRVANARVEPVWFEDGKRFWYRNELADGGREFVVVDPAAGTRRPAFDHRKLADALAQATDGPVKSTQLPFDRIAFPTAGSVAFESRDKSWRYDVEADRLEPGEPLAELRRPPGPQDRVGRSRGGWRGSRSARSQDSPDGKWTIERQGGDLRLRNKESGESFALTEGGTKDDGYEPAVYWSPDSSRLIALRRAKGESRTVHLIESSPTDQLQPRLHALEYLKPGDQPAIARPHLFDVASRRETPISDELFPNPWSLDRFQWSRDSSRFTFLYNQRGHQILRLIAVDAATGAAQAVVEETSETFVDYSQKTYLNILEDSNEILWMSERSGWNHLYLIDARTGRVKNAVTRGDWVVRGVDRVDEEARQIWFHAGGIRPGQDPYQVHYARVDFDGGGLVVLTEGDGTHDVEYSPDRRWIVDSYSRVDLPPVTELRSAVDGTLVRVLERGDWSALLETGWRAPERFVAKGRDGRTDIYGVIFRPSNYDPKRRYPVVEQIYAGPHGAFAPKSFAAWRAPQSLAELGFIVVQIDGMGTNWRSKAFHDVCWKNLADAGFPDRILWMKAAAAKDPALDLSRVGIYGGSAGGQNAMGALLFHPEFYKVGVADCGCHDNRMDKIWWNEAWMGWPIGAEYAAQSNVTHAHKLQGKLLLFVGELDRNVDPASTMQVVNALIKAKKDFDFVVFPGAGHGAGGSPYGERRQRDFFVRHLLKVEPPDRNGGGAEVGAEATVEATPRPPADRPVGMLAQGPSPTPRVAANAVAEAVQGAAGSTAGRTMSEIVEEYSADYWSLKRSFPAAASPSQVERLRRFGSDWLATLGSLDFDALDQAGRVDYLLLQNHLVHENRKLDAAERESREIASYLPFAESITTLEEARRRMEWGEPAQVADQLDRLVRRIKETDKAIAARLEAEAKTEGPARQASKVLANRAAGAVQELASTLRTWYAFHDGYDPLFTWWAAEPYKAVEQALSDYAKRLREQGAGLKPGAEPTIIGDPIGRDALRAELASAMIPYAPEDLIALAEREFAWCEAEMRRAARDMGCGDDWKQALEKVKSRHVEPGRQPVLVRDLALEAVRFVDEHDLVTIPPLARETWRIEMMSPRQQLVNPFLTGGEIVSVSFPTSGMTHEQKLMSMRGNNQHFARATVHHEVIPGHHLQGFMSARHRPYRRLFRSPFLVEGWPLYWEMLLWDKGFAKSPEDRVGMLFWRMHRCARIMFSLSFHLGKMTPQECIDLLVDRVGHERDNATAEVRRSFGGLYEPLYQSAYMLGGLQLRALRNELVDSRRMTEREFHDAVLRENAIPIEMIRASLTGQDLTRDSTTTWRFADPVADGR